MKWFQAMKNVIKREAEKIQVEEKVLDEKRFRIQKALEQSKTACKGLNFNDKLLKGLYFSGWKVNSVETSTMIAGQLVTNVRFMGIEVKGDHIQPFEYQETLTNPESQVADMQRIVATIREKVYKMNEWYPIILKSNSYYENYIESRIR
jgi:hypothetical protein